MAESLLRSTSSSLPPLPSALRQFTQDLEHLGTDQLGELWLSRLKELRERCSVLRKDNDSFVSSLHPDVALVHRQAGPGGAHLLALKSILDDMGWHDDTLMDYLESGFPMAGDLPLSHLWFEQQSKSSELSIGDLIRASPAEREALSLAQRKCPHCVGSWVSVFPHPLLHVQRVISRVLV